VLTVLLKKLKICHIGRHAKGKFKRELMEKKLFATSNGNTFMKNLNENLTNNKDKYRQGEIK
jgi:hypothetical protein